MPYPLNVEEANYVGTHPCTTWYPLSKMFGTTKSKWDDLPDLGVSTPPKLLLYILKTWPKACFELAKPVDVGNNKMGYAAKFSNSLVMFEMMKTNNNLREDTQITAALQRLNKNLRIRMCTMMAKCLVSNSSRFTAQPPGTLYKKPDFDMSSKADQLLTHLHEGLNSEAHEGITSEDHRKI